MSLTQHQQLYEILQKSNYPVITFGKNYNGDIIASSLALAKILTKMDKPAEIVAPSFSVPANYNFLEDAHNIKGDFTNLRKLTISIEASHDAAHQFSQEFKDNMIHIHVTPQSGHLSKDQVFIKDSHYRHDLIITLNTPDLAELEHLYHDNTDFFYHVPIVNIDHSPENEHYGHLNIVNITATSVSEIIYDLIDRLDPELIDHAIATHLLTGMIEKTNSFKTPTITPKSLNIASQLMAAGAKRELIIQNLYQTKTVNMLKLWGKILLNLNTDQNQKIAWAHISDNDFQETATTDQSLFGLIEDLISNIPTVELSVLFFNKHHQPHCLIKSEKGHDLKTMLAKYEPQGHKNLINFPVTISPEEILSTLKQLI